MARGDLLPLFARVLHAVFERPRLTVERGGLDAEVVRDARPHPFPAEHVAIHDIEVFVARIGRRGGPFELPREQPRVGHIGETFPLRRGAGEDERLARLLAQRGIDGEGLAHITRIAEREADDRMRAMPAPAEAILFRGFEYAVFLLVVEVIDRLPALFFTEWRERDIDLR